jgi:hypothetical protein
MIDILGGVIIVKVYSHQLDKDFAIKSPDMQPKPNLFLSSGNQIVDNAATQAKEIANHQLENLNQIFYPLFSPRWCFTYEGCITNKGAAKVWHEKVDEELSLRIQHQNKQGAFYRQMPFNGLKAEQIGNESLLWNIIKGTAPCWKWAIYRYPPLVDQIWNRWRSKLCETERGDTPIKIPKNWRNMPQIADDIIKRCPFCNDESNTTNGSIGNLEHLHLYCTLPTLKEARAHCNQKIEDALFDIYNYTSKLEYNWPFQEWIRLTTLQEELEKNAVTLEKAERTTVCKSKLFVEAKARNKALLSRNELNLAILLNRIPAEKLREYDKYPLTSE